MASSWALVEELGMTRVPSGTEYLHNRARRERDEQRVMVDELTCLIW